MRISRALLGTLLAAAAAGLSLAALLVLPLDRELLYGFNRNTTATPAADPITPADGLPYTRHNIRFDSRGTSCDAWLYTPRSAPSHPTAATKDTTNLTTTTTRGGAAATKPRYPVVIMAHGLGAQKELGLHRFADAFARVGGAVLAFDYRTFGGSEGEPRHWASPRRHLDDWRAALALVKTGGLGPEYDTEKVALWGTSYAGGHVLVVASEQPPGSLAAVISMVPHLDGLEASKASVRRRGLPASLRLLAAGLHDRLRAAASDAIHMTSTLLFADPEPDPEAKAGVAGVRMQRLVAAVGRRMRTLLLPLLPVELGKWLMRLPSADAPPLAPAYVRLVGLEGEMALMQLSPDQLRLYFAKHPAMYEGGWRPVVLSRFTLETSSYSPIKAVPRVNAPVLFVLALRDQLCPPELVRRAAALLPPPPPAAAAAAATAAGTMTMTADGSSISSTDDCSSRSSNSGGGGSAELLELDCTHFEAYLGEHLAVATEAMVSFLRRRSVLPPEACVEDDQSSAGGAAGLGAGAVGHDRERGLGGQAERAWGAGPTAEAAAA